MAENNTKYLDYEGLGTFKQELDKQRAADNLATTQALNSLSDDIGNGTLIIKRNDTQLGTFTANQKTGSEINISVPDSITDMGNGAVTEILNIIKYGQPDVSDLTDEQKAALEEAQQNDSGYTTTDDLNTTLASYGKSIAYDSATKKIQLKNGTTILSEFDASAFLVDGMLENVKIAKGSGDNAGVDCLIFDFNTDSGVTDIEIPIENFFNASNYYTKSEVDASFATKTWVEDKGYVTTDTTYSFTQDGTSLKVSVNGGTPTEIYSASTSTEDKAKLDGIEEGAEVNVQSDWNITDTASDAFIKNKPTLGALASKDSLTAAEVGALPATTLYAGSSTAGGSATSAEKLDSSAGSATQPVYFNNGVPAATTYSLEASVPADAVFTDTHHDGSVEASTGKVLTKVAVASDGTWSKEEVELPAAEVQIGMTATIPEGIKIIIDDSDEPEAQAIYNREQVDAKLETVNTTVSGLQSTVGILQTNLTTTQGDVTTLQRSVSAMQDDIDDLSTLGDTVSTLSSTVASLPRGIALVTDAGTTGTITISSNKMYNLGTLTGNLTVNLASETADGYMHEYMFAFSVGDTAYTLTLPEGVTFPSDLSIEANKHYEINIKDNYGLYASWG